VAVPGGNITLALSFYDENTGLLADPSALQLDLTYGGIAGTVPDVAGPFTYQGASSPSPGIIYRTGTGTYAFTWDIPPNALPGVYTANWTAAYGDAPWLAVENFPVTPAGAVAGAAQTLPLEPSDEQVAVGWLSLVPGLSPAMVATRLPPDADKQGNVMPWVQTGFVTVSVVGGNPDAMLPVNRPVFQVDCWAVKPGSSQPPWWQAAAIASAIRRQTWQSNSGPRQVLISAGSVTYPPVAVRSAYLATTFRRVYDDAALYAHFAGDLVLDWVRVPDYVN
jgi:hypothetical protein